MRRSFQQLRLLYTFQSMSMKMQSCCKTANENYALPIIRACENESVSKVAMEQEKTMILFDKPDTVLRSGPGHFMFWPEVGEAQTVCTTRDMEVYTHILYMDVSAEVVVQHCRGDVERNRAPISATHARKWQQTEMTELSHLCRRHGILFSRLSNDRLSVQSVSTLLNDLRQHNEEENLSRVNDKLDEAHASHSGQLMTMLLMDADRTLSPDDTGTLFWDRVSSLPNAVHERSSLKDLFSSQLGYSYTAFRQAVLLYEETGNQLEFDSICRDVASSVTIHPEFISLLEMAAGRSYVGAVVVTSGVRRIWEMVLERHGLSETLQVIGGSRIADGIVVTPEVKGAVVDRLRDVRNERCPQDIRLGVWG